jgi:biotin carboxylase
LVAATSTGVRLVRSLQQLQALCRVREHEADNAATLDTEPVVIQQLVEGPLERLAAGDGHPHTNLGGTRP